MLQFALLLMILGAPVASGQCTPGWIEFSGYCYYFEGAGALELADNWNAVEAYCANIYGY